MSDQVLTLTDLIYDAAAGAAPWTLVGRSLERLVDAQSASLMAGDFRSGGPEILYHADIPPSAVAAYQQHYKHVDLWTNRAFREVARTSPPSVPKVWTSGHLVSDDEFLRSEFYNDFGRGLGLRYVVGTVVPLGEQGAMPIGLHRPSGALPFGTHEARLLERVLPHLRRALQLRHQLRRSQAEASVSKAALDALTFGAVVVDSDARIVLANAAAEAAAASDRGVKFAPLNGMARRGSVALTTCHVQDGRQLSRLIAQAAHRGGSGGALRAWNSSRTHALALLVSPLPTRLLTGPDGTSGRVPGRALVLMKDLSRTKAAPPAHVLRDLFGLSRNEAEVARALVGGATKEAVAAARGLRPTTIKTQLDSILAKTGATNLRDLERLLASLRDIGACGQFTDLL
jgi:DNA-binding CsgD family transcriptional regulator